MPLAESQAAATLRGMPETSCGKNACISKLIASVWLLANGVQYHKILNLAAGNKALSFFREGFFY